MAAAYFNRAAGIMVVVAYYTAGTGADRLSSHSLVNESYLT
jgi:hypothetical protein